VCAEDQDYDAGRRRTRHSVGASGRRNAARLGRASNCRIRTHCRSKWSTALQTGAHSSTPASGCSIDFANSMDRAWQERKRETPAAGTRPASSWRRLGCLAATWDWEITAGTTTAIVPCVVYARASRPREIQNFSEREGQLGRGRGVRPPLIGQFNIRPAVIIKRCA
jgi:hypothetical protein